MGLTGGKRKVNKGLKDWVAFVKKVQKEEKLSYKEAIHRAKQRKDKGEKWMKGGSSEMSEEMEEETVKESPTEMEEEEAEAEVLEGGRRRGRRTRRRSSRRRGRRTRRRSSRRH